MAENPSTKVIIGPVRLSYVQVWEAKAVEEGKEKKFSVSLIIPKHEKKLLAEINKAIDAAAEIGKAKLGGKIPANLKRPLRDGDEDRPEDEAYENSFFVNANSSKQPQVLGPNKQPLKDQNDLYSGCYGYVSVNFYAYNTAGNKGIGAGLNNIMKWKDGESLGGRNGAESDFAEVEVGDDFLD